MIKILKTSILAVALALVVFAGVHKVQAAALTFSVDTNVTINGNPYFILAGSEATSVVVGETTLTATVPDTSTFTLISVSGYTLTNDQDVTPTCSNSGVATLAYTSTGVTTIIITPSTEHDCNVSSGGGVRSSGGGGGGSSSSNSTTTTPAVTTTTNTVTTTTGITYNFGTTLLKNGSRGEAVKELQRFMNKSVNLGLVIDGMLGPKTIASIKTWQRNNGLVPDGLIGPKTKAMMNAKAQLFTN